MRDFGALRIEVFRARLKISSEIVFFKIRALSGTMRAMQLTAALWLAPLQDTLRGHLPRVCFAQIFFGNSQLSLIFGVPNFCSFSLLVLCLFKVQVEATKRKIRDTKN